MELLDLKKREVFFLGPRDSEWLFIQPVDEHDRAMPESEKEKISSLAPGLSFALAAFSADWDSELAPWDAEPVFRGQKPFSGGARTTLTYIEEELLPARSPCGARGVILGGYSLAGLFALWAGYESSRFRAVAAASPSVWFPGYTDYAAARSFRAGAAALSLGDREDRTRHPLMCTVGSALKKQYELLAAQGIAADLTLHPGNHFVNADGRMAAAFVKATELADRWK
ncbi:MAG: esterase [Clostridia bacterium]|nr:esterase [Clostridia bacterium]